MTMLWIACLALAAAASLSSSAGVIWSTCSAFELATPCSDDAVLGAVKIAVGAAACSRNLELGLGGLADLWTVVGACAFW